ncbi:zinc finger homeobox protein 3-like isoform 1-T1 [Salvelinus alpinus]
MNSGEGGRGRDGGREGGQEREPEKSHKLLSHPLLTLEVIPCEGLSSRTLARAPAKEPPTLIQTETEQGGAEGTAGREETPGGERVGHSHGGRLEEEKLKEKKEKERILLVDDREETVERENLAPAFSSKDRGGKEEKQREEAISNQSQTNSKCSLLPRRSQHSSASCTVMASGTLNNNTLITEMRDTRGVQGSSPNFPLSFIKPQKSALPEYTSTPVTDDRRTDTTHTSLIANGDTAKVPKPNNNPKETDGKREGDGEIEGDKDRERDENLKTVSKYLHPSPSSPGSLNSHMALMHSWNSCKMLKCPKCNWHYKSQQTLHAHLREKHPASGGLCVCGGSGEKCVCGVSRGVCVYCSTGKAHPRLSRGESYVCEYKPYRCGVCDYTTSSKGNLSIHMQSDKHLSNVQVAGHTHPAHGTHTHSAHNGGYAVRDTAGEQGYGRTQPTVTQPPAHTTPYPSQPPSHGKRWRCEVCDYETSIARNLRIHTTSEKHMHNVLRLKQTPNLLQRSYYLAHCRSLPPQLTLLHSIGGEQSLDMHQLSAEEPVAPDSTLTPSPSPPPSSPPPSPSSSPPPPLSLSPSSPLSCGVFQCLVCSSFSSDSLESLRSHLSAPCSLPQSEWRSLVAGGCYCRLCGYSTPLRANFTLHCQTDRHRAQYQLASHLWEAGDREEFVNLVATGNPVQLKCNLCDFQTTSLEKLKIHSINPQHQASLRVSRFLQQYDSAVDGGSWLFHCVLCNYSSCSKLHLLRHTHSPGHQKRELHYLQLVRGRSLEEGEGLAATFTIRKCPSPETGGSIAEGERRDSLSPAKRSFSGLEETQSPLSPKRPRTDQRTTHQQATAKCPLCQDTLVYTHLRRHLILIHSVVQDCVDKLMSMVAVELPEILQKETLQMESHSNIKESQTNDCNTNSSYTKESLTNEPQTNDYHTKKEKVITAKDVPALLTPPCKDQHPAEDNTSHLLESPSSPPSPPTLSSLSPSNLPSSTLPPSPPSDAPPPSDCHGYRFRCGRCSLAVRRQKKLQMHWQYHAMRAATECHLCPRRCRSQEALQRHLLNTHLQDLHLQGTHPDQSGAHIQQPISLEGEEEEGESMSEEETDKEEDDEEGEQGKGDEGEEDEKDDPDEEEERPSSGVGDSDQGSRQQEEKEAGSEPNPFSKGFNPTLERFLDPARPYKCSFCCESFTQRTILPVLYNSLSHRARARRVLQDSSPSPPDTRCSLAPDPSSYRCRMCRVANSQSSTLDIHLRSVLHQTRARGARTQLSLNPHTRQTLVPALVQTTSSSRSPGGGEVSTRGTTPTATRSAPSSPSPCSSLSEAQLSVGVSGKAEGHQAKRRRVEDLTASGGQQDLTLLQQQVAQAQMPQQQHKLAQAHIEEHTALLQPQLFSPTLLPHLPLLQQNLLKQFLPSAAESLQQRNLLSPLQFSPDSLFSLQQQMIQSFYLSGGLQLNPNMNFSQITSALSLQTISALSSQTNGLKHPSPKLVTTSIQFPAQAPKCETQAETADSDSPLHQTEKESNPSSSPEGDGEMQESKKRDGAEKALRVLLERYGWELALQSNQSRQRQQNRETGGCLEEEKQCGECGKQFSDSLILKSHQEFVHQQMITPVVLETFSRQYDCLYPLTPFPVADNDNTVVARLTPATAPVLAPLPPAPVSYSRDEMGLGRDQSLIQAQSLSQASAIGPDQAVPTTPASVPVTLSTDQAPVNSFCPAQASPTPSPPPPSSQTQPLPEQQQDTMTSTTTSAPSPTIIPQSNLSMHFPLSQLPLPPLPLPSLPTLPFPIDLSLLPLGLMQPIALQSMLQYQSLLSSGHQPPLSLFTNAHSTHKPSLPSYTNTHCAPSPSLPPYTNTHCAPSPSLPPYTNTHCAPSQSLPPYTNTHCAPSPSLPPYTNTHSAPSPSLTSYTNTHCAPSPSLTSYTNTHCAPSPALPFLKRRLEEGTAVTPMRDVMDGEREEEGEREGDEQRRDRRQRTTISSAQLEVLYQRYSLNSNPTRSVLEGITRDTGLKKRVVQVWFQNTRARQRKGQLQSLGRGGGLCLGDNHRRCPFCRALFNAQNALDAHVRAHHCSQTDRAAYGSFHQMGPADDSSFSHNH